MNTISSTPGETNAQRFRTRLEALGFEVTGLPDDMPDADVLRVAEGFLEQLGAMA